MGFHRREYNGRLEEQKRDLELEQQRRQQEEREHRSNVKLILLRTKKQILFFL